MRLTDGANPQPPIPQKAGGLHPCFVRDERLLCKRKAVRTSVSNPGLSADALKKSHRDAERQLWDDLDRCLCENFPSPDLRYNDEEAPEDPIIHTNNCAFIANLVEPRWSWRRFNYGAASYVLHDVNDVKATAPEVRDAQVIGGARFIISQAPTIFDQATEWQDWLHAFRAVANDETYGKECQASAQQAADFMALQEKIVDSRTKEA